MSMKNHSGVNVIREPVDGSTHVKGGPPVDGEDVSSCLAPTNTSVPFMKQTLEQPTLQPRLSASTACAELPFSSLGTTAAGHTVCLPGPAHCPHTQQSIDLPPWGKWPLLCCSLPSTPFPLCHLCAAFPAHSCPVIHGVYTCANQARGLSLRHGCAHSMRSWLASQLHCTAGLAGDQCPNCLPADAVLAAPIADP